MATNELKKWVMVFLAIIISVTFIMEIGNSAEATEEESVTRNNQPLNVSLMRIPNITINNVNESFQFSINQSVTIETITVENVNMVPVVGCILASPGNCAANLGANWSFVLSTQNLSFYNNTYMVDGGGKNQNFFVNYEYTIVDDAIEGNEASIVNVTVILCALAILLFILAALFYKKKK